MAGRCCCQHALYVNRCCASSATPATANGGSQAGSPFPWPRAPRETLTAQPCYRPLTRQPCAPVRRHVTSDRLPPETAAGPAASGAEALHNAGPRVPSTRPHGPPDGARSCAMRLGGAASRCAVAVAVGRDHGPRRGAAGVPLGRAWTHVCVLKHIGLHSEAPLLSTSSRLMFLCPYM